MRLESLVRSYVRIATTRAFWAYTLPGALSYGSIFVFISGASFVLIRVLGVATENYGYIHSLGVVGYLFGSIICRRLLGKVGLDATLRIGTALSLLAGFCFAALALAGANHWAVVLVCMFLSMFAHGINVSCTQAGAVAPFPQQAGAAAGLMGFVTMVVALLVSTWVGASFDGTLLPLAYTSATVGLLLFASAQLLIAPRSA